MYLVYLELFLDVVTFALLAASLYLLLKPDTSKKQKETTIKDDSILEALEAVKTVTISTVDYLALVASAEELTDLKYKINKLMEDNTTNETKEN